MALSDDDELAIEIEKANFIMLSLYREYSKLLLKNSNNEFYEKQMALIKHDLIYLNKKQMVVKAREIYNPILKNMLKQ